MIVVEDLSKAYRIGKREESHDTLVGAMQALASAPLRNWRKLNRLDTQHAADAKPDSDLIWALKGVSFEIAEGEVVGIVGRNGAGKSTLLKILSRITDPTQGRARIRGRVSSLLEVGTGFHPELTGRENVYMNGTILGMTKSEIDRKFDEIVEFSGVAAFLDTPTKRFSSGMQVRLAFAVAAHLEPEILIVDEVLAVGDVDFQRRCVGKMRDVASGGRTVLFVSHNLAAVQALCSRGIVLESGQVVKDGEADSILEFYQQAFTRCSNSQFDRQAPLPDHAHIARAYVADQHGHAKADFRPDEAIRLHLNIRSPELIRAAEIGVGINDGIGVRIATVGTYFAGDRIDLRPGDNWIHCDVEPLRVRSGEYSMKLALGVNDCQLDEINNAISFHVSQSDYFGTGKTPRSWQGPLLVNSAWQSLGDTPEAINN